MDQNHVTDFLPAYALDALDREDKMTVTRHLSQCDQCQAELLRFNETASLLATVIPQINPPADLKKAILARVQPSTPKPVPHKTYASPDWKGWFSRAFSVWGVASLALVIGLIISNIFIWQQFNLAEESRRQVEQQLAAQAQINGQFRMVPMLATDQTAITSAMLVIAHNGASGTLVVNDLPALDNKHQYQLWLNKDGKRNSGGVFSAGPDGYNVLEIDQAPMSLLAYTTFGVTIEPYGGSPGPTGKKVLGGKL